MPHRIDQAGRLLALAKRDMTSFPPDQFSILNPFAVILRYEEIPYVSISLATMVELVELAYQWACDETRGAQSVAGQ